MSDKPIPVMRSMEHAEKEMPKHLMYGTMHGYELRPIQTLLKKVFGTKCVLKMNKNLNKKV